MNCPNCNSSVKELLACDTCNSVGCIRCVIRLNRQWVCEKCRGSKAEILDSSLFGMFK